MRIRGRALQTRNRAFLAANPLCVDCRTTGRVQVAVEVDHIVPLFKGGADEWENLQGLCVDCHKVKTARDKGYKPKGCDASGVPTDRFHHWNQGDRGPGKR